MIHVQNVFFALHISLLWKLWTILESALPVTLLMCIISFNMLGTHPLLTTRKLTVTRLCSNASSSVLGSIFEFSVWLFDRVRRWIFFTIHSWNLFSYEENFLEDGGTWWRLDAQYYQTSRCLLVSWSYRQSNKTYKKQNVAWIFFRY